MKGASPMIIAKPASACSGVESLMAGFSCCRRRDLPQASNEKPPTIQGDLAFSNQFGQ
jgi:hypothetical protein